MPSGAQLGEVSTERSRKAGFSLSRKICEKQRANCGVVFWQRKSGPHVAGNQLSTECLARKDSPRRHDGHDARQRQIPQRITGSFRLLNRCREERISLCSSCRRGEIAFSSPGLFGPDAGRTDSARGPTGVRGQLFPHALMVVRDADFSPFFALFIWRCETAEYNSSRQSVGTLFSRQAC